MAYRVGQIVKCHPDQASGVIVGWDEVPIAPSTIEISPENSQLPHYLILMDTIEANLVYDQLRYLAQTDIQASAKKRIINLAVGDYFENYQHGRYVMRPWLEGIYPRD